MSIVPEFLLFFSPLSPEHKVRDCRAPSPWDLLKQPSLFSTRAGGTPVAPWLPACRPRGCYRPRNRHAAFHICVPCLFLALLFWWNQERRGPIGFLIDFSDLHYACGAERAVAVRSALRSPVLPMILFSSFSSSRLFLTPSLQ